MTTTHPSLRLRLAFAVLGLAFAAEAHAQTPPPPPVAHLSCVFDRLEPKDRELVADSVLGAEPGDGQSRAASAKLDAAAAACVTAHGWDKRRAGLSGAYAMNRSVYDVLEKDFAAAGIQPGRLKALWATLTTEDRAALRDVDIPDAVAARLVVQLNAAGVPNTPDDLLEAYSSLAALSEIAALEAAWRAL